MSRCGVRCPVATVRWSRFNALARLDSRSGNSPRGAGAVVFGKPVRYVAHRLATEPVSNPWGYDSPFYGPGWGYRAWYGPWAWGGYADSMAVPCDQPMNAVSGTAIRYIGPPGDCFALENRRGCDHLGDVRF